MAANGSRHRFRAFVSLAVVLLALVAAGCGDDDEEPAGNGAPTQPPATETAPPATETTPTETGEEPEPEEEEVEPPPEEQPGGAGDEEPIQSQAAFSGRGGRVAPRMVRVPPFIAVRIELRSADGGEYGLSCGGREVRVDTDIETASTRVAGRRPGEALVCRPLGAHNGVVVSPSAEPGP